MRIAKAAVLIALVGLTSCANDDTSIGVGAAARERRDNEEFTTGSNVRRRNGDPSISSTRTVGRESIDNPTSKPAAPPN